MKKRRKRFSIVFIAYLLFLIQILLFAYALDAKSKRNDDAGKILKLK